MKTAAPEIKHPTAVSQVGRRTEKIGKSIWSCGKTPETHFYMGFYQILFFGKKKKNSPMLFLTIDFTFSFRSFDSQIIKWFLGGEKKKEGRKVDIPIR